MGTTSTHQYIALFELLAALNGYVLCEGGKYGSGVFAFAIRLTSPIGSKLLDARNNICFKPFNTKTV